METVTITRITAREAKRQLELGVPKTRVASLLGVHRKTLWQWMRDGTFERMIDEENERAPRDKAEGPDGETEASATVPDGMVPEREASA